MVGILLQLPLPSHIDKVRALDAIHPSRDVDGLHPLNAGLLVQGRAKLVACTPLGVIEILRRYEVPMSGRRAVVVGRSDLVGKPVATLLMHENATVTVCHSKTQNLAGVASEADIIVAAMGKPAFLKPDFVREGAVVIDVGTTVLKSEDDVVMLFGAGSRKVADYRAGKTVLLIEHKRANTEIMAVLDGEWAAPCIEDHPDVTLIYTHVPIGQRATANLAAGMSTGI